ncbi:unnamed protein product [Eruca vesicaria subsp. sativa]|uniref:Uncharacterized protein n=1 Tax=Eruca vesicaria subsp. sativa TaxID=29727 RepID=A0ABC8JD88_ERUVS|nr:unnamed protein product [Eruca vesicaria subsp. sativa]
MDYESFDNDGVPSVFLIVEDSIVSAQPWKNSSLEKKKYFLLLPKATTEQSGQVGEKTWIATSCRIAEAEKNTIGEELMWKGISVVIIFTLLKDTLIYPAHDYKGYEVIMQNGKLIHIVVFVNDL